MRLHQKHQLLNEKRILKVHLEKSYMVIHKSVENKTKVVKHNLLVIIITTSIY